MFRFMTSVLALALLFQSGSASAEVHQGLKSLFDQYHYTMQVEWNQQDSELPRMAKSELLAGLEKLRGQGLAEQEIRSQALAQIKNEQLKLEMNEILALSSALAMTPSESEAFTLKALESSYQSGANWSGDDSRLALGLLAFVALIVFVAVVSDKCPREGTCYECDLAYEECY
jgi:hypothetical protein